MRRNSISRRPEVDRRKKSLDSRDALLKRSPVSPTTELKRATGRPNSSSGSKRKSTPRRKSLFGRRSGVHEKRIDDQAGSSNASVMAFDDIYDIDDNELLSLPMPEDGESKKPVKQLPLQPSTESASSSSDANPSLNTVDLQTTQSRMNFMYSSRPATSKPKPVIRGFNLPIGNTIKKAPNSNGGDAFHVESLLEGLNDTDFEDEFDFSRVQSKIENHSVQADKEQQGPSIANIPQGIATPPCSSGFVKPEPKALQNAASNYQGNAATKKTRVGKTTTSEKMETLSLREVNKAKKEKAIVLKQNKQQQRKIWQLERENAELNIKRGQMERRLQQIERNEVKSFAEKASKELKFKKLEQENNALKMNKNAMDEEMTTIAREKETIGKRLDEATMQIHKLESEILFMRKSSNRGHARSPAPTNGELRHTSVSSPGSQRQSLFDSSTSHAFHPSQIDGGAMGHETVTAAQSPLQRAGTKRRSSGTEHISNEVIKMEGICSSSSSRDMNDEGPKARLGQSKRADLHAREAGVAAGVIHRLLSSAETGVIGLSAALEKCTKALIKKSCEVPRHMNRSMEVDTDEESSWSKMAKCFMRSRNQLTHVLGQIISVHARPVALLPILWSILNLADKVQDEIIAAVESKDRLSGSGGRHGISKIRRMQYGGESPSQLQSSVEIVVRHTLVILHILLENSHECRDAVSFDDSSNVGKKDLDMKTPEGYAIHPFLVKNRKGLKQRVRRQYPWLDTSWSRASHASHGAGRRQRQPIPHTRILLRSNDPRMDGITNQCLREVGEDGYREDAEDRENRCSHLLPTLFRLLEKEVKPKPNYAQTSLRNESDDENSRQTLHQILSILEVLVRSASLDSLPRFSRLWESGAVHAFLSPSIPSAMKILLVSTLTSMLRLPETTRVLVRPWKLNESENVREQDKAPIIDVLLKYLTARIATPPPAPTHTGEGADQEQMAGIRKAWEEACTLKLKIVRLLSFMHMQNKGDVDVLMIAKGREYQRQVLPRLAMLLNSQLKTLETPEGQNPYERIDFKDLSARCTPVTAATPDIAVSNLLQSAKQNGRRKSPKRGAHGKISFRGWDDLIARYKHVENERLCTLQLRLIKEVYLLLHALIPRANIREQVSGSPHLFLSVTTKLLSQDDFQDYQELKDLEGLASQMRGVLIASGTLDLRENQNDNEDGFDE